jgi:hypothetical protein
MRDDRAAKIDGCPHEFDEPTGQCRQCGAHYTTIIDRYRTKALTALPPPRRRSPTLRTRSAGSATSKRWWCACSRHHER